MPLIPVNFAIMADGGVEEGGSVDTPTATVKFKVAWADRYAFVNAVCGTVVGGPGAIARTVPLAYPPSPNLYATRDFSIEPLGKLRRDDDGWAYYDYAIITVNFAVPTYSFDGSEDPSGTPWTTTTIDVGGEFLTLPESTYKFAGGVPVGAAVGRIIPSATITFKRHWVPFLPVGPMLALIGKVNNAPVRIAPEFTAPAETLLFLGGPNNRESDTAANVSQSVEYKLSYRPINWNKFLHPNGTSGFQYIFDGSGNKVYELGDFSTLP